MGGGRARNAATIAAERFRDEAKKPDAARGAPMARGGPMNLPSAVEIARQLIQRRSVTPADDGALPYLRDLLSAAGFAAEIVSFAEPGTPTIDNLYARIGDKCAASRLRRPHRRRAARRSRAMAVRSVLRRNRRRHDLGPRRLRHEGRRRRGGRRRVALRRARRVRKVRSAFSSPATRKAPRSTAP